MPRLNSGRFGGRALDAPQGLATRPTSDRVRQAVFNLLSHASWTGAARHQKSDVIAGAVVADFCAGSGALGFEALSRGAVFVTFVDNAAAAHVALNRNVEKLGVGDEVRTLRVPLPRLPKSQRVHDLVFFDPPYADAATLVPETLQSAASEGWFAPQALLVLETAAPMPFSTLKGWQMLDQRRYGGTLVSFWRKESQ